MRRYQLALVMIDLFAASAAAGASLIIRFGPTGSTIAWSVLIAMPIAWVIVVAGNRAYEALFVGVGQAEFERVFHAFLHLTVLVVFVAYATKTDLARGFVVVALPTTLVLDFAARYAARKVLHRLRARGRAARAVLVLGDLDAVLPFIRVVERDRYAGMRVVGVCLTNDLTAIGAAELRAAQVPLLGGVDAVVDSAASVDAHAVAVVSSSHLGTDRLRWIAWQLEGTDIDLVVSPGLAEVAGRRLHIQPVAGLPLLHVEQPAFRGLRRLLKDTIDRNAAALALLMLSPVFLAVWLAVRLTSSGPVFFRQSRVGRDGGEFTMVKFRSMYVGAEQRRAELLALNVHGADPLFKMRDDPRVTPVGRFLRRYSIDELPQFLNVLCGHMSLVGPRPPLPSEVALYGDEARRRLLVKPGLTGLWQISGRSDLSWDESVQLDLRYVENWSPALDLMILWKTAAAVLRGSGAY
jgi:exopolysaccharide biosynthesis polyprenyl glycosylphosphotransferase